MNGFFSGLKVSLRFVWRDLQHRELNLLFAAIVIAVATVTSITLFAERLQKALVSESNTFLAAELVLRSPDPVDPAWLAYASKQSLQQAEVVQFPSMVFAGDEMFLASVKAVSDSYPLLGQLEISTQAFGEGIKTDGGPAEGEAWLDSRLLNLLNVGLGDEVWVGDKALMVKQILVREPDGSSSYWSLGPRILISTEDLAATHIVQAGSRVEYRYLFSGADPALEEFKHFLKPLLQPRHRLMTLDQSQPGLAQSLKRAESFLLLAGSLAVLLAAIAVAMAARHYSLRHLDTVALLKVLGARLPFLKRHLMLPLLLVLVVGVLIGFVAGQCLQSAFLYVMRDWLPASLPSASWKPYVTGFITAIVCVMGFALPLLWQLLSVPPLRVLRRELGTDLQHQAVVYLIALSAIFLLMWFFSGHLSIAAYVFFGALIAAAISGLLAWLLLLFSQRIEFKQVKAQGAGVWRLALRNLQRNRQHSILQLVIFSLVFMLLIVSVLIRTSLINQWQQQLPEKTPNQFLINIAPYQVNQIKKTLVDEGLQFAGFYPMVRGRLTHINGKLATVVISEQVDELYRELNFSWSAELPEDNQIVSGRWWPEDVESSKINKVSIEAGLANKLHIKVGDMLSYSVGDQVFDAQVWNVRSLAWDRMRPNFYFMFAPGVLESYPATYITSFYLPADKKLFLNQFLRQYPTVSIFSVDEMIRRIQIMVKQVSQAIEVVLGLILFAGLLVLIAVIQSSMDQRIQENTLLRSLGASRRFLLGGLALEFIFLGLLAGMMGALGAEVVSRCLQTFVFRVDNVFYAWPWFVGPVLSVVLISGTGLMACAHVVRVPPWRLLQEQNT